MTLGRTTDGLTSTTTNAHLVHNAGQQQYLPCVFLPPVKNYTPVKFTLSAGAYRGVHTCSINADTMTPNCYNVIYTKRVTDTDCFLRQMHCILITSPQDSRR